MAADGWNLATNSVVYDKDIYSSETGEWVREVKAPKRSKPSMQESQVKFNETFLVEKNVDTGMINISIEHYSPFVAKLWVEWLVEDINLEMKIRDKEEAERSINYLQTQIAKTNNVEQKSLLYQLIEEQAKTLMFAEVRNEYVFKTIDPALVSEIKSKPNRALIVFSIVFLGGLLGTIYILVSNQLSPLKDRKDKI